MRIRINIQNKNKRVPAILIQQFLC